jgi:[ribosomal protein S5]-alanine N-acetyltransferase
MTVILQTTRLLLREVVDSDLDFVAALFSHPEVMRYYPKCYSREECDGIIERQKTRYAEYGHGMWLALDRAGGHPVGFVGLVMQEVDGQRQPEIGYLIHFPYWRQGLATEAALGVRTLAFETLQLPYVISLIRPENIPSQGVARKLGMQPLRETFFHGYTHLVFCVRREFLVISAEIAAPAQS